MPEFLRENSLPMAFSVALHGLLAAAFIFMTYLSTSERMPSLQPLPIDAVAIDSKVMHAYEKVQADRAEEAAAQARAAAEAKAAAEADARAAAEQAAAPETPPPAQPAAKPEPAPVPDADDTRQAAAQKIHEAQQAIADAKRAAEAKRAGEQKKAADAKQAEEQRRQAEVKQVADAKRTADERARQASEAELRRQLADEERTSAVRTGPLRDRYITLLRNRIQNAWIKPPSATTGVDCIVEVTQVTGGEVTAARVTQCNGDAAVRQSIENAVYRASPLPDPPDPALFEKNLSLRFRPNE